MANSPRMKWPYPAEGVDPWYDAFESMVSAQDASTYALKEAKNVILAGGGIISWTSSTGTLTWADPITFNSASSGFLETLPAGSATVTNDGSVGYVTFISSPQSNVTLSVTVASTLPASDPDRTFVLFRRKGSKIFFRNGGVLDDGDSAAIIDDGPGASGGGVSTFVLTAAEAISAGEYVAVNPGGLAFKASSTVAGRYPALGVCTVGAGAGSNVTIQCIGAASIFSGLTVGTTYCLAANGTMAATPPMGAIVFQPVLTAYSATSGVLLTTNIPVVIGP